MLLRFAVQGGIIAGISPLLYVPTIIFIPTGWIFPGFAAAVGLVAGFVAGIGSLAGIRISDAIGLRWRHFFVAVGGATGAALALWLCGIVTADAIGGFIDYVPMIIWIGTAGAAILSPLTVHLTLRAHKRRSATGAQPINS